MSAPPLLLLLLAVVLLRLHDRLLRPLPPLLLPFLILYLNQ